MKDAVQRPEPDRDRGAMSKLVSKNKRRSASDDSSEDSSSSSYEGGFMHSKKRNKSKKKKRKHSKVYAHIIDSTFSVAVHAVLMHVHIGTLSHNLSSQLPVLGTSF